MLVPFLLPVFLLLLFFFLFLLLPVVVAMTTRVRTRRRRRRRGEDRAGDGEALPCAPQPEGGVVFPGVLD